MEPRSRLVVRPRDASDRREAESLSSSYIGFSWDLRPSGAIKLSPDSDRLSSNLNQFVRKIS